MVDILAVFSNTGSKSLSWQTPKTDTTFFHGMQLKASLLEVSALPSPFKNPCEPFP